MRIIVKDQKNSILKEKIYMVLFEMEKSSII